jgi:hypothetical protein
MSKPRDPILAVLHYFETAELPLARQALALAGAVVRRRSPKAVGAKPKKTDPKRQLAGPGPAQATVS